MQEAGDVAEGAEEDVDEGVGGAEAGFDPDCRRGLVGREGGEGRGRGGSTGDWGEEDGEESEEDVAGAHCCWGLLLVVEGWMGWRG